MNRKIRIYFMIGTLDVGGAEGQLVELVTNLDRSRFEPTVCCLSSGGYYENHLKSAGIPVEIIGFRGLSILSQSKRVISQLYRLVQSMKRAKPDIVHAFLFWAYVIGAFSAKIARVPIFVSSRRSLGLFKADKPHYLFFERLSNLFTRLVISNSEAVRQDTIIREKIPKKKLTVIHNGLNLNRFREEPDSHLRDALDLKSGTPIIGVVSNFIHYKGYQYFLEGWVPLLEKFPNAVALFVGEGPVRKEIEAKADVMGISESLLFLGVRNDIPQLFSLMDVVVHPSLQEGFSNAILEAMAAGKPLVATSVGGNPEAVIHGETGLLVPPMDGPSIAKAIIWLLENKKEAAEYGKAGRRRVYEKFNISVMVKKYEEVYERLIGENSVSAKI